MHPHPAVLKLQVIRANFNPDPIINFAVRDKYVPDEATARKGMDGVLQWLAGHAVKTDQAQYVMMYGDVDNMLHAFMLNTRLYVNFCRDFVGSFIHHTPLDDTQQNSAEIEAGIDYTLAYLQDAFGDDLAPALKQWVAMRKNGELRGTSVSCTGNDLEGDDIADPAAFKSFWDRESAPAGMA